MSLFASKSKYSSTQQSSSEDFFGIQAKLNIGKSNDKYEVEADKMADKVVNNKQKTNSDSFFNPSPTIQKKSPNQIQKKAETEEIQEKPLAESITPVVQLEAIEEERVQTKCEKCEQEEKAQKKDKEEEKPVQSKSDSSESEIHGNNLQNKLGDSKGSGSSLDKYTKQEMESGFGSDFNNVRIHTDSNAVRMSQELDAQAFTHGNDVYFNKGKYNPSSKEGKHLLAHELTHTIQQGGMVQKKIQKSCGSTAIGPTPNGCILASTMPTGTRFFFKKNCDEFESGEENRLRIFARTIAAGSTVDVLGLASSDGNAANNESLSCHRANQAEIVLNSEGISPSNVEATGGVLGTDGVSGFRAVDIEVFTSTPVPTPACMTPTFVPGSSTPTSIGTRGGCGSGPDFDFHHFPSVSSSINPLLPSMRSFTDGMLEGTMRTELFGFAGSLGVSLFNHFNTGTGTSLIHGAGTTLSTEVDSSPTFTSIFTSAEVSIQAQVRAQVLASCHIDWNAFNLLPTSSSLPDANFSVRRGDTLQLNAVLGGTQGLDVFIRDFNFDPITNTFSGVLIFEICDDFGVDNTDLDPLNLGHGSPGLVAFWILQHERPSRHVPYINGVNVERPFAGTL